jgi:hypothetical protein
LNTFGSTRTEYRLHCHSRFQVVCLSTRHETWSPVSGSNHRCAEEKVQAQRARETDRAMYNERLGKSWRLSSGWISTQGLPRLWVETAPKWPSNCVNNVMQRIGSFLAAAWVSRLITNPSNVNLFYVRFVFWNSGATLSDVMVLTNVHTYWNLFRVADSDQELMLL